MTTNRTARLVFLITSDPRQSHRPAEAIRVAAGIAAWKRAEVKVYLRGPAVLALGEWVDELKDEDNYTRYLPLLAEQAHPFYVQSASPQLLELGDSPYRTEVLSESALAGLIAEATTVLHF